MCCQNIFYFLCEQFPVLNAIRRFYTYVLKIDLWMQLVLLIIFVGLLYLAKKKYKIWRAACVAFLPTYVTMLFMSLVFSRPIQKEHLANMVPLWTIRAVLNGKKQYIKEIVLNCFMLYPVGFLYPVIQNVGVMQCIYFGGLISIAIEAMQFLFMTGMCEIDDILYNVSGCVIGYWSYLLVTGMYRKGKAALQKLSLKQ